MDAHALFGLDQHDLTNLFADIGEKPYRAKQVFEALYKQRVHSVEDITTLRQALRDRLMTEGHSVGIPEIVQTATSVDGTERYLMRMADGETVETVWMPDGDGGERGDGSEAAEEEAGEVVGTDEAVTAPAEKQIPSGNDNQTQGDAGSSREAHTGSSIPQATDAGREGQGGTTALQVSDEGRQGQGGTTALQVSDQGRQGQGGSSGLQATDTAAPEAGASAPEGTFWSRRGQGRPVSNFGTLATQGFRRATICISSQVGCAVNCQFCLTAKLGIKRNLTAGEIAGQVAAVLNRHNIQIGKDRINLVFMGMGEPFLNYTNFIKSVRLLVEGIGIPESRMTVSTSGILPGIQAFAGEKIRPKLALSLNASNDTVREQIMPITRKWNIAQLLEAVQQIPLRTREWITFEYVLLGGVNDQPQHAREVLALLAGLRAKVNLIVWNPGPGIDYSQPKPADVTVFQKMLIEGGIATYIRRPRGRDIYAACGQLKRTIANEQRDLITIGPAAV